MPSMYYECWVGIICLSVTQTLLEKKICSEAFFIQVDPTTISSMYDNNSYILYLCVPTHH